MGVSNARKMVENSRGYTREDLWRTLSRTSPDSCESITEWVETIKNAKVALIELEPSIPQWTITFVLCYPCISALVLLISNPR